MNTAVWVAAIGAIPLTITAVASVIAATNSKRVARETKTNGGATMKDDLVALRAHMHRMHGNMGVIANMLAAHVTSSDAHEEHARQEAIRVALALTEAEARAAALLEGDAPAL